MCLMSIKLGGKALYCNGYGLDSHLTDEHLCVCVGGGEELVRKPFAVQV